MKKTLMIIMPSILVAPLLFGCQKNTYSFSFHSDYCELNNKSYYPKNNEPITLTMTLKEDYQYCAVPDDVIVLFDKKEGTKDKDYTYTPIIKEGEKYAKSATLTLVVTADISVTAKFSSSDNNFRINPKKYDGAIDLNEDNLKYVQRSYEHMIIATSFVVANYIEDYASPTVYNCYTRQIQVEPYPPVDYYIEKADNDYYKYSRDSSTSPWKKKPAEAADFKKPSDLSFRVLLDLGGVTYDLIKDTYDPLRRAYYFTVTKTSQGKDYTYDVVMSFYNDRLTFFSYSYVNEYDQVEYGILNYTYGEITPKLPEVNPSL